jgi:Nuclease-related domain
MRFVPLSDHPSDMLAEARRQRESAQRPTDERRRPELAARQLRIDQAGERRDQARNPLSRLRWALTAWWRRFARPSRQSAVLVPSHGEEAIMGGIKGEQEVADVLNGALSNAWTLVKGYRNRRGEIDYLLLGPGGLFAIEVKYVNGTFTITRERWRYIRYDRYGNQVGDGLLQDARRRPPNAQLAEPLAMLEHFLASRGQSARMRPVVLLNHPKARVSHCAADIGVEVLTSTARLCDLVLAADGEIGTRKLAEIERLVIRDHHFHEEHRPASRGGQLPLFPPGLLRSNLAV